LVAFERIRRALGRALGGTSRRHTYVPVVLGCIERLSFAHVAAIKSACADKQGTPALADAAPRQLRLKAYFFNVTRTSDL
jgi:hypothetical protein